MNFVIKSKNEDGSIMFEGTATAEQASFLFAVGVNYLLQKGALPMLTGDSDEQIVAETPEQIQ